jgi:hypothetical protein
MNRSNNRYLLVLVLALPLMLFGCYEQNHRSEVTVQVYKASGDGSWVVKVDSSFPSGLSRKDAIQQVITTLEMQSRNEVKAEKP